MRNKLSIRLFSWILVTLIVLAAFPAAAVTCRSAIFSNSTKVQRLYGKNVHKRVLPASTTKVMTALLVMEKLSVDRYVTVGRKGTLVQPSKIYIRAGEQYKVKDLLYAILLNSANDASVALAEAVAGSEWEFVKMMNRRAQQLGAKHTKFANSNGLPSRAGTQYTTAYDMYLIFRAALKHPFFRQAIRFKHKTIYSKAGRRIALQSHNKMLFKGWKKQVYGKTGYTRAAGACFVGAVDKGGDTLIVAVFGCSKRWDMIKHLITRYGKVIL